jgi:hypothetical protein
MAETTPPPAVDRIESTRDMRDKPSPPPPEKRVCTAHSASVGLFLEAGHGGEQQPGGLAGAFAEVRARHSVLLSPPPELIPPHGSATGIPLTARALPEAGFSACLQRAPKPLGSPTFEADAEPAPAPDRPVGANVAREAGAVAEPPLGGRE